MSPQAESRMSHGFLAEFHGMITVPVPANPFPYSWATQPSFPVTLITRLEVNLQGDSGSSYFTADY